MRSCPRGNNRPHPGSPCKNSPVPRAYPCRTQAGFVSLDDFAKPLNYLAPRAEVPPTSRFKHLERQPALSALNDTKGVSGAVATRLLTVPEPLSVEPRSLSDRAREEMEHWFKTLSYRDRGKLKMHRSTWGREGGSVISLGVRHGKTVRTHKKLKREREARLKADRAAYEARRTIPAAIDHRN